MKIIGEGLFILGKIKVWKNPVFRIDVIGQNQAKLREILVQKLDCQTDLPFFQKPSPNTILGGRKPTFRFERLLFRNPDDSKIFDHLKLGFGENGYYYDLHLNSCECNPEKWQEIEKFITELITNIEYLVENDLVDIMIPKMENDKNPVSEISNIDLTFDDTTGLVKAQFPQFAKVMTILEEEPQQIIPGIDNVVNPEIIFHIDSQMRFNDPFLFKRSRKYLGNERIFRLVKIPPMKNRWNINSRGVSLHQFSQFMNIFLKGPESDL